jgi:hypothetical protein
MVLAISLSKASTTFRCSGVWSLQSTLSHIALSFQSSLSLFSWPI